MLPVYSQARIVGCIPGCKLHQYTWKRRLALLVRSDLTDLGSCWQPKPEIKTKSASIDRTLWSTYK